MVVVIVRFRSRGSCETQERAANFFARHSQIPFKVPSQGTRKEYTYDNSMTCPGNLMTYVFSNGDLQS